MARSSAIVQRRYAFLVSTMCAAIIAATRLDSMSNDLATAVLALRRQRVNRTFERVKIVRNASHYDLKRFVVFVTANFTPIHKFGHLFREAIAAVPGLAAVASGTVHRVDFPGLFLAGNSGWTSAPAGPRRFPC